jgi:hypothetical protein
VTRPRSSRLLLSPLWLLVALLTTLGLNASSAAASAGPETRVRAIPTATAQAVGQSSSETPASVGCLRPPDTAIASGSCVATEAGTDLVRYDPEWASRQMLDQNTPGSSGYGVTPGGRTVSAHAAERISVGGPGRPPTSLSTVDEILDTGTSVRYDPIRDSIQVRAPQMPGKPYVVVDSSGTHIVTVMVPK